MHLKDCVLFHHGYTDLIPLAWQIAVERYSKPPQYNIFINGYYAFGLCVGDKIIGFTSLTDLGDGTYEMNDVSVLPEYRHIGYGKMILDFCKSKVISFGGSKIVVD